MVNLWKRSISITPTAGRAAPNSSGRWVRQAPTSSPPFEPPWIASLAGRGDPFGDQVFGAGDEIVEDVLLVRQDAGLVPVLAVFPAAAQVGHRQHPAHVPARPAG